MYVCINMYIYRIINSITTRKLPALHKVMHAIVNWDPIWVIFCSFYMTCWWLTWTVASTRWQSSHTWTTCVKVIISFPEMSIFTYGLSRTQVRKPGPAAHGPEVSSSEVVGDTPTWESTEGTWARKALGIGHVAGEPPKSAHFFHI